MNAGGADITYLLWPMMGMMMMVIIDDNDDNMKMMMMMKTKMRAVSGLLYTYCLPPCLQAPLPSATEPHFANIYLPINLLQIFINLPIHLFQRLGASFLLDS